MVSNTSADGSRRSSLDTSADEAAAVESRDTEASDEDKVEEEEVKEVEEVEETTPEEENDEAIEEEGDEVFEEEEQPEEEDNEEEEEDEEEDEELEPKQDEEIDTLVNEKLLTLSMISAEYRDIPDCVKFQWWHDGTLTDIDRDFISKGKTFHARKARRHRLRRWQEDMAQSGLLAIVKAMRNNHQIIGMRSKRFMRSHGVIVPFEA